jgi:hypothetical protein
MAGVGETPEVDDPEVDDPPDEFVITVTVFADELDPHATSPSAAPMATVAIPTRASPSFMDAPIQSRSLVMDVSPATI